MFVPPFPHAQESQILNCHEVTEEDSYHRTEGKISLSFCAIPRAKSLKHHKRATPFQFKPLIFCTMQKPDFPIAEYQSWNIVVQNTFEIEVPC